MATFTPFDEFLGHLGQGKHSLASDVFKGALTDVAPDKAANTVMADITQIAAGFGYVAGGSVLNGVLYAETAAGSGVWRFSADDLSWTAAGGDIAAHRYLVIYNDTQTVPADPLVGFVDRGSSSIIADGHSRTWDIGASGLVEISAAP